MDDYVKIFFNGKEYNVKVDNEEGIDINECITALNNDELFNYLYNYQIDFFNDINTDPYFDGKTIKSGEDLKNSIEEISLISCRDGVIYICGEYWCDPEHGFSIKFPGGKFVKSEHNTYNYNRDEGKYAKYIPVCTLLGLYSDCL